MSDLLSRDALAAKAIVHQKLPVRHEVDRTFGMPTRLYGVTVGLYLGFLAIMAAGMRSPGLFIPMAIFTLFIVAGFGVPALWTRLQPATRSRAPDWSAFRSDGIMTHTGRLAPRDASIQMLILPVLILCWALACVTIVAFVA